MVCLLVVLLPVACCEKVKKSHGQQSRWSNRLETAWTMTTMTSQAPAAPCMVKEAENRVLGEFMHRSHCMAQCCRSGACGLFGAELNPVFFPLSPPFGSCNPTSTRLCMAFQAYYYELSSKERGKNRIEDSRLCPQIGDDGEGLQRLVSWAGT